jgi:hypothetical protein
VLKVAGHTDSINWLSRCFQAGGRWFLASGSDDRSFCVWEVHAFEGGRLQLLQRIPGLPDAVTCGAVTPFGAAASGSREEHFLLSAGTGPRLSQVMITPAAFGDAAQRLSPSPTTLLVASDDICGLAAWPAAPATGCSACLTADEDGDVAFVETAAGGGAAPQVWAGPVHSALLCHYRLPHMPASASPSFRLLQWRAVCTLLSRPAQTQLRSPSGCALKRRRRRATRRVMAIPPLTDVCGLR